MPEVYCGAAPEPRNLALAWNADPVAIALCVALVGVHVASGQRRGRPALLAGTGLVLLLFVSPLCALTVALFSARVAHHVLLVSVAAPLLALAFREVRIPGRAVPPSALVAVNAAILWFWHVPQVYEVAIVGALPYWTMQLSLLAAAFLLWRGVLSRATHPGLALFALLATMVQMGLLGALLTFARRPLYAPHFASTEPYGLSPLADQQLAGLIMWVPASLPYLAAAVLLLAAWGAPASRPVP